MICLPKIYATMKGGVAMASKYDGLARIIIENVSLHLL